MIRKLAQKSLLETDTLTHKTETTALTNATRKHDMRLVMIAFLMPQEQCKKFVMPRTCKFAYEIVTNKCGLEKLVQITALL